MPLDINCFPILAGINSACEPIKIGDFKQVGVMIPFDDIDRTSIVYDGCKVKFNTKVPSAVRIYDRSFVPFKGSEVTEENKERFKEYMDTVIIPIIERTPENGHVYYKLSQGTERYVIVLGIEEATDAEMNHWQVFGLTAGLKVKTKTVDIVNQSYLTVTMQQMNSGYPALFLWDTSYANTLAKLEASLDYAQIYGGTIATGATVKFEIDANKTGYIKLPNGTILTTVAGIINTTYTGVGGAITFYSPKSNTNEVVVDGVPVHGTINTNIYDLYIAGISQIVGVICSENTMSIKNPGNINQAVLIAQKATVVDVTGCSIEAKYIGDVIYKAYSESRVNVNFKFGGGSNASMSSAVNPYFTATYGLSVFDVIDALIYTYGGVVTYNA